MLELTRLMIAAMMIKLLQRLILLIYLFTFESLESKSIVTEDALMIVESIYY